MLKAEHNLKAIMYLAYTDTKPIFDWPHSQIDEILRPILFENHLIPLKSKDPVHNLYEC